MRIIDAIKRPNISNIARIKGNNIAIIILYFNFIIL